MSSPATTQITFREMRPGDIETGLRLCRASRWNQTQRDWELFLKVSPHGCFVAVKDERVVGTVATLRYEDHFSWISMVLVDSEETGQGIGASLMAQALDALSDMPSVRLDATPAGHRVYRKLDFVDEYPLSRMEMFDRRHDPLHEGSNGARKMTAEDLPAVATLDREVFGADRRTTLEWILEGAPQYAWLIEDEGQVVGYTFGRRGFDFEHIGPVIANHQELARQLVYRCLTQTPDRPFIIDASHIEADWRLWLESIGFREQRPFVRMFFRNNPFPGLPSKQFGILGPEFG